MVLKGVPMALKIVYQICSPVFLFYLRQDTCIHLTDRIAEPFDLQHVMCCDKNSLPSLL